MNETLEQLGFGPNMKLKCVASKHPQITAGKVYIDSQSKEGYYYVDVVDMDKVQDEIDQPYGIGEPQCVGYMVV